MKLREGIQQRLLHGAPTGCVERPRALAFADPDRVLRQNRLHRRQRPGALQAAQRDAERSGLE